MQAQYAEQNPPALKQLVLGGTKLQRFPPDVVRAVQEAAQLQAKEYASRSPEFARLHEAWRRAQTR